MENPLCRLCLTPNSGRTPLFDKLTMKANVLLLQKVIECTSIRLTAQDDYPSSICTECERKLNELSAFKIQCIVNNDYYREKQAELRKRQLSCSQQPTEVVCLDDDDDEEEEEDSEKQKALQQQKQEPLSKKMRIEQVIIEDDDEDEGVHYEQNSTDLQNYESEPTDTEGFNFDDFELVEGQEVDQSYEPEEEMDNNAILSSILLDAEEDNDSGNALLMEQGHYEKVYPYECEYCRHRYSSLTKLESHVKTHSQNRMKCFICGKMVVVHLLRHLRSQHPGMSFPEPVRCWHTKCSQLDEVFLNVNQLLAHMDTKRRRR
ncbi:glutamic acid-rich protein-like [Ochlerotatus camptorhynchus]|uniref:glutamic acid-rich protein-like n=1 Tax=Ochlerotatus camptorhynchus TaxID=644619 RepID=UPI0031D28623